METPFPVPPSPGQAVPVAPGIFWLRMPLPFALDHVNLWLIEDGDGWALVDTGLPDRKTRELWEGILTGPMAGRAPSRLVVTHFHPDHLGLAAWLGRRFGLTMEATLAEWLYGRMLSLDSGEGFIEASRAFYRAAGFDDKLMAVMVDRGNAYGKRVRETPPALRRLQRGEEILIGGRRWRVMVGRGHSPEHACLWCEELEVLISGDQILPSISPNVSVWPNEPQANPLHEFLDSLQTFRVLPDGALVLPSHGLPFRGLHARIDALEHHHDERLSRTLEACGTPLSAYDLLQVLFRRELDTHQLFFALGESLAHLHYLLHRGDLQRETDAAGVCRFGRL